MIFDILMSEKICHHQMIKLSNSPHRSDQKEKLKKVFFCFAPQCSRLSQVTIVHTVLLELEL